MRDWVPVRGRPLSGFEVTIGSPAGVFSRFQSLIPNLRTEFARLDEGKWSIRNDSPFFLHLAATFRSENGDGYRGLSVLRPCENFDLDWQGGGENATLVGTALPSAQEFSGQTIESDVHRREAKALNLRKWEHLFYRYLAATGASCSRIAEGTAKSPDFSVSLCGQTIPIEFKEFHLNPQERRSAALMRIRGYGEVQGSEPGHRIMKLAETARSQLQCYFEQHGYGPGILAIFDSSVLGHAQPSDLAAFFEGILTVSISVADLSIASVYRRENRRRAPYDRNRLVSAIAIFDLPPKLSSLLQPEPDEFIANLAVYHNPRAAHPLCPDLLAPLGFPQYVIADAEHPDVRV